MLLLIFCRFSCSVCDDYFVKDEMKHKLLTCVFQHKKFLFCFYGATEKAKRRRRGEGRSQLSGLCPSPPPQPPPPNPLPKTKLNKSRIWLVTQSPGSKVRGKVSFVPSAQRHTHPSRHVQSHAHAHTPARARLGPKVALCSANQKTVSVLAAAGTPSVCARRAVCSSEAVQRLVTDSNNNQ